VPCTGVKSGAGTLQVPCTGVKSGAEISLLSLRLSLSQGASLGDFLLAPGVPYRGLPLFNVGIRNGRGCCERKSFWPGIKPKTLGSCTQYAIHEAIPLPWG